MSRDPRELSGFAIGNDEQYRPVQAVGHQRVAISSTDGAGLLMCHASGPLDRRPRGDGPLLVVVHGALRDSDRYLAHARRAARLSGPDPLIVAPQFLADVDTSAGVPDDALRWEVEGWKGGYPAVGPSAVSSFGAMDDLLDQLTAGAPGGRDPAVVLFGNSAGGQFVNRYAAVGRGPDLLAGRGLAVRFVISNPSTYLYFDRERPVAVREGATVNRWRYGFDQAPPYVDAGPRASLERYLTRDVTLVLGALDHDRASRLLEVSPPAMAQGADRLDRGLRYDQHVRALARAAGLPARHRLIQLTGIGHAAGDVLAAPQVREVVFTESRG
jgi:pimeloyl-ACP methyl ester carboxylesterase